MFKKLNITRRHFNGKDKKNWYQLAFKISIRKRQSRNITNESRNIKEEISKI